MKRNINLIGLSGKIGSGKNTVADIIQFLDSNRSNSELAKLDIDKAFALFKQYNESTDYKRRWEIKSFAGKIKEIVALLIGCTVEDFEDREFKEKELGEDWEQHLLLDDDMNIIDIKSNYQEVLDSYGEDGGFYHYQVRLLTPRLLMQLIGTEFGRKMIHPNLWVNALFADYHCIHCGKTPCSASHGNVKGGNRKLPNWIIADVRFPDEAQVIKDRGGILIRVNRYNEDGSIYGWGNANANHPSEISLDSANFDFVIENNKDIKHLINEVRKILK